MKALLAFAGLLLIGAEPMPAPYVCQLAPADPVGPAFAPNSTFVSDGEPPKRFRGAPKGFVKVAFGQENIDKYCGHPPCAKVFLGCTKGDLVVLPDPFTSPDFARITRHELGHFNGWSAAHGD